VNRKFFIPALLFGIAGCARLPALTPSILEQAENQWRAHRPAFYRLVIDMSGDRVEAGRFDAMVRSGEVVSLRRNGLVVLPSRGQDYSMEGLFRMLEQELGLAEKPALLGAPPGYSVYTTAEFDANNGRLIHYRRVVGGTSNSIDVKIVEYVDQEK
jgi:hypothetical protein